MVKIGFIVEGDSEKIVIESDIFKTWATRQGIEVCSPVINAKGGGNLLPQNIGPMIDQIKRANPDHIVILTDLEHDPDPTVVLQRIGTGHTELVFVAVKALEAWFLADHSALERWLGIPTWEEWPERTRGMPWDRLRELAADLKKRGPGPAKPAFAKKMVTHYQFAVANAATHPNCPSAKQFHDRLIELASPI